MINNRQNWERDAKFPCLSLGKAGAFDDTHISSPCVVRENKIYRMYYTGSRGTVNDRVFRLGLAVSEDGVCFNRYFSEPLFAAKEDGVSVLTPAIVRSPEGHALRVEGKLRLYYSCRDLSSEASVPSLRYLESSDGIEWEESGDTGLSGVYSPCVLCDDGRYRMWFTDVTCSPWAVGYAESSDGIEWEKYPEPHMTVEQEWEHKRLNYPYVVKLNNVYYMWYGSQLFPEGGPMRTAIGTARSSDGIRWEKSESNPVFEPDPKRKWESTYVSDQCIMVMQDGRLRMWYASRTDPPTEHKYYAIGTAVSKLQ